MSFASDVTRPHELKYMKYILSFQLFFYLLASSGGVLLLIHAILGEERAEPRKGTTIFTSLLTLITLVTATAQCFILLKWTKRAHRLSTATEEVKYGIEIETA